MKLDTARRTAVVRTNFRASGKSQQVVRLRFKSPCNSDRRSLLGSERGSKKAKIDEI